MADQWSLNSCCGRYERTNTDLRKEFNDRKVSAKFRFFTTLLLKRCRFSQAAKKPFSAKNRLLENYIEAHKTKWVPCADLYKTYLANGWQAEESCPDLKPINTKSLSHSVTKNAELKKGRHLLEQTWARITIPSSLRILLLTNEIGWIQVLFSFVCVKI